MEQQNHPLYATDRENIDRLLSKVSPNEGDLVDLARLLIRYEQFPGAFDLKDDMEKTLNLWGLSREMLESRVRQLWSDGFRPGKSQDQDEVVGSSFDTADGGSN